MNDKINKLLAISLLLNGPYDMLDERFLNISVELALEIRQLLSEGYNEQEIIEMINNIDFDSLEEKYDLNDQAIIKADAMKSLKIINKRRDNYE